MGSARTSHLKKRARSRQKSVYTGPLRERVMTKNRSIVPNSKIITIHQERRSHLSPKSPRLAKNKYPAFGLPRVTATAGGMGIGLDDYIFNNSKMTDAQTPGNTKGSESFLSRPDERNSTFLWSRGSSSRNNNRIKGVHTERERTANKTVAVPHIGIQDGNVEEQPLENEQDLEEVELPTNIVTTLPQASDYKDKVKAVM